MPQNPRIFVLHAVNPLSRSSEERANSKLASLQPEAGPTDVNFEVTRLRPNCGWVLQTGGWYRLALKVSRPEGSRAVSGFRASAQRRSRFDMRGR